VAALALAVVALSGCKLVDQRTFGAPAAGPSTAALGTRGLPRYPLLTLPTDDPDADWRPSVDDALRQATARRPDATFDVVAPVPIAASTAQLDRAAQNARADTAMVADELRAFGIPDDRIMLRLAGDAGQPPREVLLYAR
jgi:hypothetical protein